MSNTFASLLRGSRLATYDRSLNQVYTTSKSHKRIGDWGLKRNLPTVIRTKYAIIQNLDTAEHQTPWQSGNSKVLFIKRWKENFPQSKRPVPRSSTETHNIVNMTPAEFQRFLSVVCAKQAPVFQQLLNQKELVPEQVFDYLNVTFKESVADHPVGPTYSDYLTSDKQEEKSYVTVEGRILNGIKRGHAVGVGGVVAFLPKRYSMRLRQLGDRSIRTFYVESASIDEEGRPKVVLTTTSSGTATSSLPFMFQFEEDEEDIMKAQMSTANMFLIRKERLSGNSNSMKDDESNILPNPDHEKLMSRIAGLIQKN